MLQCNLCNITHSVSSTQYNRDIYAQLWTINKLDSLLRRKNTEMSLLFKLINSLTFTPWKASLIGILYIYWRMTLKPVCCNVKLEYCLDIVRILSNDIQSLCCNVKLKYCLDIVRILSNDIQSLCCNVTLKYCVDIVEILLIDVQTCCVAMLSWNIVWILWGYYWLIFEPKFIWDIVRILCGYC